MTDDDLVQATCAGFLQSVRASGEWLSGDFRVSPETAADLLGLACSTLANIRLSGEGPTFYRIGGSGHKISYRLIDLAAWVESKRAEY